MIADAATKRNPGIRNLFTTMNIPMGTGPILILMNMIMNTIRKQAGSFIMIISMTSRKTKSL